MSSKPQRDSESSASDSSDRQPLPFEPTKSRKQADRKADLKAAKKPSAALPKRPELKRPEPSKANRTASASGIPDAVSRRMVKRMAFFCGIPTALGMSTFVVSYLIITSDIYEVPTYAVLLTSLGFFGLGILGLSYGALSASWDEETPGSRFGWSEFTTNWGRMTGAWKATREESAGKKS